MPSFVGTFTYAIDHKGRIAIPPSMRRGDSPKRPLTTFFLNRGFDSCVAVYSPDSWQRMLEKIRKFSPGDPRARAFKRAFLKEAMEVTVDTQGRVTIPPALIAHAALGKEAVLHGSDNCIEIWNPKRFEEASARAMESPGGYEDTAAALFKEEV
ncbi:MAG TPA: division/cell wall cluster transcriptional repressor MraZ [Candidatus Eisenbacteria bacterium]|nr:division/cell wall cluster transcriptional repressor MraZ [Candidatus Eisenbacteria bacterium]